MKKTIIFALTLLAFTGCTSVHTFESPAQNHNLKGTDKTIKITGNLKQTLKEGLETSLVSQLSIYFDNVLKISGFLDSSNGGEFNGQNFNEKTTSANCSTKKTGQSSQTVFIGVTSCMVFIDNERTVTLTF